MVERKTKNIEASVRARLSNLSKETGENYNALLLRFLQERLLARLAHSQYKNHFVLKGGFLLMIQHINKFRPTIDIDMLGVHIDNNPEYLKSVFKEITQIDLSDGVIFNHQTILAMVIKEDTEYKGLRFSLECSLGNIKNRLQLDIGFGDIVSPGFIEKPVTSLLDDFATYSLLQYPFETIISEKLQARIH